MNIIQLSTEYWNIRRTEQKKQREELSLCNVLFCLLVIFIHVSSEPVTLYLKDSPLYILTLSLWRLSSFVVQGFLFLSGVKLFLHYRIDGFSYPKFLLGRLKRVVLPYVVAVCLFYGYFLLFNAVTPSLPGFLRNIFIGDLSSHFYFVIIIVQFYLLMPLWRAMAKKGSALVAIVCSLLLMLILKQYLPELLSVLFGINGFAHNHRLFTSYMFYFILGVFAGLRYDEFIKTLRKQTAAVAAAWAVTAGINCLFIYWNSIGKYYALWLDNFHILYCFLSILLCLALADKAANAGAYQKIRPLLKTIDTASYEVYLIHPLFIFMVNQVLGRLGVQSVSLRYAVRFGAVYGLCLGFCFLWRLCTGRKKKT